MSNTEIIDVLDPDGNIISTMTREEAERDNHLTENVLICIFNSQGKVWTQLRPKTKKHYPGVWDISACGGIISGEKRDESAQRETFEETGLKVDLRWVESFLNVFPGDNGEERKRLSHLYVGYSDETPLVNDEVDEFKNWELSELRSEAIHHPELFIPSFLVELDKAAAAFSPPLRN